MCCFWGGQVPSELTWVLGSTVGVRARESMGSIPAGPHMGSRPLLNTSCGPGGAQGARSFGAKGTPLLTLWSPQLLGVRLWMATSGHMRPHPNLSMPVLINKVLLATATPFVPLPALVACMLQRQSWELSGRAWDCVFRKAKNAARSFMEDVCPAQSQAALGGGECGEGTWEVEWPGLWQPRTRRQVTVATS